MLLACQAAWREDEGLADEDRSIWALSFGADAAVKAAAQAVQIFGGYGYTKEFPVERYLRDAKTVQLVGGSEAAEDKGDIQQRKEGA